MQSLQLTNWGQFESTEKGFAPIFALKFGLRQQEIIRVKKVDSLIQ